jgi:hypothetical protein
MSWAAEWLAVKRSFERILSGIGTACAQDAFKLKMRFHDKRVPAFQSGISQNALPGVTRVALSEKHVWVLQIGTMQLKCARDQRPIFLCRSDFTWEIPTGEPAGMMSLSLLYRIDRAARVRGTPK